MKEHIKLIETVINFLLMVVIAALFFRDQINLELFFALVIGIQVGRFCSWANGYEKGFDEGVETAHQAVHEAMNEAMDETLKKHLNKFLHPNEQ